MRTAISSTMCGLLLGGAPLTTPAAAAAAAAAADGDPGPAAAAAATAAAASTTAVELPGLLPSTSRNSPIALMSSSSSDTIESRPPGTTGRVRARGGRRRRRGRRPRAILATYCS
eukprot:COSAG01_NODE_6942_length_3429_cov_7.702703_1_plen_115_part_00